MSNMTLPTPRKHRNLAQLVVEQLTEHIRNGALHPGDKLPTETEIMTEQGVSRSVVREAISRLQAAGVVETRHGIGTFVLPPPPPVMGIDPATVTTVRDVIALLELRIGLETEAAGLAATRRTDAQMDEVRAALAALQQAASTGQDTVELDQRFHLAIAQASGNEYFRAILQHLGANIIPRARVNSARLTHADPVAYMEQVGREHQQIVDAIARGDAESARAAMRLHIGNSRERLRRAQEALEAVQGTEA
ncbi:GntR family transcriptional regulator [Massilia sp. WF1]|uniref:FadR/GntR family transcriptional regulator n=1 Tax=unclassified Massilia TaxID=2609279 RepID=UPI00069060DA|nr:MULTISPECIES: FadR/GntR family transcriptional regulator [unclassified Massilia]ALK98670.1 GntR family transcriptional regulator [Massilia sp. WG5]KNZ68130.1 GntR family transcriptional regulator [Massilia sp. WF1]